MSETYTSAGYAGGLRIEKVVTSGIFSLDAQDFSRTQIDYDRDERSRLALTQGRYTQEHFIEPHREVLEQWAATVGAGALA